LEDLEKPHLAEPRQPYKHPKCRSRTPTTKIDFVKPWIHFFGCF
jgi:hypothetical protein